MENLGSSSKFDIWSGGAIGWAIGCGGANVAVATGWAIACGGATVVVVVVVVVVGLKIDPKNIPVAIPKGSAIRSNCRVSGFVIFILSNRDAGFNNMSENRWIFF